LQRRAGLCNSSTGLAGSGGGVGVILLGNSLIGGQRLVTVGLGAGGLCGGLRGGEVSLGLGGGGAV